MSRPTKEFHDYPGLVVKLRERGMDVGDPDAAEEAVRKIGYYRLSGYCYPFRQIKNGVRQDGFWDGTSLAEVVSLYRFDHVLRVAAFKELCSIEVMLRTRIGHELGRLDPLAHRSHDILDRNLRRDKYDAWLARYDSAVEGSREDFVEHHRAEYDGVLPIWAGVELLGWGDLAYLFEFAPRTVRDQIASEFGLNDPQLRSWLRSLNQLRNTCAHHGRLFNRVAQNVPKFPQVGRRPDIDEIVQYANRTFGQLSLIQYLAQFTLDGRSKMLAAVLRGMPTSKTVPPTHVGIPNGWDSLRLWSFS